MRLRWGAAGVLIAAGCLQAADLASVSDRTIKINDIRGVSRTPFQIKGSDAAALFFVMHDCPISNYYAREIKRTCTENASKGLHCYLVYVEGDLTSAQASKHIAEYEHGSYPAIVDRKHVLVAAAGVTTTPEVAVVDSSLRIRYRGRIDNFYAEWGKPRRQATEFDLRNALEAVFSGREVPVARTSAVGCFIPPIDIQSSKR